MVKCGNVVISALNDLAGCQWSGKKSGKNKFQGQELSGKFANFQPKVKDKSGNFERQVEELNNG